MNKRQLYLLDATAFCYRAFYALSGLSTSYGQPTNAVYGFVNILNKIFKDKKPGYMAACFDVSRDTFRQKKFAEYKIQRPPMPDGLSSQIPLIKEIISAYGIPIFEKEGYEADDIIATICRAAKSEGTHCVVVSSDKDILQLVDEDTVVFSPYKDEGVTYDKDKVLERFGVPPDKITDIIALMGDDADNIPGVRGIGEKTASGLIVSFGSLEKLLAHIDDIKQEKLRSAISGDIDKIKLNKELAELDCQVKLGFKVEDAKIGCQDNAGLARIFKRLEFKKLLKNLPQEEGLVQEEAEPDELKDADLPGIFSGASELYLAGENLAGLAFFAKGRLFRVEGPQENLKMALEDAALKKTGHDLKKIKVSLAKDGVNLGGLHFDTMIAAHLLNPAKPGYGLSDLLFDHLNIVVSDKAGPARLAELLARLAPRLEEELQNKGLLKLFRELEMPLVEVLSEVEQNGVKLDAKVLKGLSREIEKRLISLNDEIYGLSGTVFNINSPKQLREILFEKLKLPVVKRSKTGPSTDEEVLRRLSDKHALPKLLLEYRQLMKLKNTYVDTLPLLADKDTHRIHASFNQAATETGRLSSSDPNLQNIPIKTDIGKNIRRAFVASGPQNCLLSCDYSQIELRILAHLSKDKELIAAFERDLDIHKATASLIYGVPEVDVAGAMRDTAKRVNFGIVYGLTSYGLSRDLGITVDDAQRFIEAYFARYPYVQDYINKQIERARGEGFVTTLLGRRRYIPEINNKNMGIRQFAERQAVNTPIQGTAADLIKLAMIDIQNEIKKQRLGVKMVLQVHDELVFDVPKDGLEDSARFIREKMEGALKLDVPIKVDIKKGDNWLEMEAL